MPDPKFVGCWHCGKDGHTRQECDDYKKDVGVNPDGTPKRPYKGCMGAFEKRNKRDRLKTLQETGDEHEGENDGSELDELEGDGTLVPATPEMLARNGCHAD